MVENLQYRLFNASIAPPGDAWAKIAEELDKESEHRLSIKMQAAVLQPPADAWENILGILNETGADEAKVIPISRRWSRIAVAAIAAGIIVLAGLHYFMSAPASNDTASQQTTQPQNNTASDSNTSAAQTPVTDNSSPGTQSATNVLAANRNRNPIVIASMGFSPRIRYSRVKRAAASNSNAGQVNVDGAIVQQVSLQPAAYIAPKEYLTVTAPNGQPAKISARFTDAVTYVMADVSADNMNTALKSIGWKQRINKWCNKLMTSAAFIPAGTNFLDIIELEELLKD